MKERWVPCIGYEKYIQVSNLGNVMLLKRTWVAGKNTGRVVPTRLAKQSNRKGYLYVNIRLNGITNNLIVHRLIAMSFIPNPENKKQVNHINGNKLDNRIENLEWLTPGENQKHAYATGLKKRPPGGKRSIIQLSADGSYIKTWDSIKSITDALGYDRSAIIRVAKNRQKSCYGFKWSYENEKNKTIKQAA